MLNHVLIYVGLLLSNQCYSFYHSDPEIRNLNMVFSHYFRQLSTEVADLQGEVKRLRHIAKMYGADNTEIVSAQVLSKSNQSATKAGLKNMMAQILHLNTKIAT